MIHFARAKVCIGVKGSKVAPIKSYDLGFTRQSVSPGLGSLRRSTPRGWGGIIFLIPPTDLLLFRSSRLCNSSPILSPYTKSVRIEFTPLRFQLPNKSRHFALRRLFFHARYQTLCHCLALRLICGMTCIRRRRTQMFAHCIR